MGGREAENRELSVKVRFNKLTSRTIQERQVNRRNAHNRSQIDLRMLAKTALSSIEKKLRGIHRTSKDRVEKEVSTSNLVQMLIQEATDNANLASRGLLQLIYVVSDFLTICRGKCIPVGHLGCELALMDN